MEMSIRELVMHPVQLVSTDIIEIEAKKTKTERSDMQMNKEHMNIDTKLKCEALTECEGYSYIQLELIPQSGEFSLRILVQGKFETDRPLDGETFERFLLTQGIRLLWSYAREIVYDISGKMLREPFLLPTLDVVKTLAKTTINKDVTDDEEGCSKENR